MVLGDLWPWQTSFPGFRLLPANFSKKERQQNHCKMNAIQKKKKKASVKLDAEVWRVKGKSLSTRSPSRAVPSADRGWSWVLLVCLSFCTTPSPRELSVYQALSHSFQTSALWIGWLCRQGHPEQAPGHLHRSLLCVQTPETKGKWSVCILPRRGGQGSESVPGLLPQAPHPGNQSSCLSRRAGGPHCAGVGCLLCCLCSPGKNVWQGLLQFESLTM